MSSGTDKLAKKREEDRLLLATQRQVCIDAIRAALAPVPTPDSQYLYFEVQEHATVVVCTRRENVHDDTYDELLGYYGFAEALALNAFFMGLEPIEKDEPELDEGIQEYQQMFMDWFIECWNEADRADYPLPVHLLWRYEPEGWDLKNGTLIDVGELEDNYPQFFDLMPGGTGPAFLCPACGTSNPTRIDTSSGSSESGLVPCITCGIKLEMNYSQNEDGTPDWDIKILSIKSLLESAGIDPIAKFVSGENVLSLLLVSWQQVKSAYPEIKATQLSLLVDYALDMEPPADWKSLAVGWLEADLAMTDETMNKLVLLADDKRVPRSLRARIQKLISKISQD